MIMLTRLDGRELVVNSDLIVTVEATPDTMVTLTTGDRLLVREPVPDVVERAVAFRYRTMQGPGTPRLGDPSHPSHPSHPLNPADRNRTPSVVPAPGQVCSEPADTKAVVAPNPKALASP